MRQSDSLPVLLGKPAVPLIGFRDKDVVGGWLFISQWETYILICVIKIQPGALGCCWWGRLGVGRDRHWAGELLSFEVFAEPPN